MKKVTLEVLKEATNKLMFDMSEEQYQNLLNEFDIILSQMELISEIEGVDEVEPMTFPYVIYHSSLREDVAEACLTNDEVLKNSKETKADQVKVPKVVG